MWRFRHTAVATGSLSWKKICSWDPRGPNVLFSFKDNQNLPVLNVCVLSLSSQVLVFFFFLNCCVSSVEQKGWRREGTDRTGAGPVTEGRQWSLCFICIYFKNRCLKSIPENKQLASWMLAKLKLKLTLADLICGPEVFNDISIQKQQILNWWQSQLITDWSMKDQLILLSLTYQ